MLRIDSNARCAPTLTIRTHNQHRKHRMNRRNFLLTAGIAGCTVTPLAAAEIHESAPPMSPGHVGPLLNRPRAHEFMKRAGLDALVVSAPLNVYYVTNAVPVLGRFSAVHTTLAILPADPTRPIAYVAGGFEYYAGVADSGVAAGVAPYLVGGGFGSADPLTNPAFPMAGNYSFDAREQRRRALLEKASPFHESVGKATTKALADLGLNRAVIGADTADSNMLLRQAAPRASLRDAADLMLHIRLVKTPAELALMRRASENNVAAAIATAQAAREEQGVWRIRQRFYREASARGNTPVYGSVDLVMSELADGPLREGQAFMIDFVSHYGFYQGDYGRTVYFGEPDPEIKHACEVGAVAWREIRDRLRPGLKFSEIHEIGQATVKKLGARFLYAFNPHSVGLQHWDQPRLSVEGKDLDLRLESGMVLSVDCPLLNAGVDGTTHIEDLTLITDRGAECIHRVSDDTIQV
jgi:Xaa-Pro aminopeptidase